MHNFCSCCIKKFKVTNLTLYMYLFIEYPNVCYTCMPFIYVDVHIKTILAVTLFSIECVSETRVSEDGVCCKIVFL